MRIFYLSGSTIPSDSANSIHVMRMCRAFADLGHEVVLFAQRGDARLGEPFAYYGVAPKFRIEWVAPVSGALAVARHAARYWGRHRRRPRLCMGAFRPPARYAATVRDRIRQLGRPDLIYGRHPAAIAAALALDLPAIFESHRLPGRPRALALEQRILRDRNLRRLVTVSGVLRRDYLALFPWLDPARVLDAHDGADPVPEPVARAPVASAGYVGSYYPGKGVEVVIALASRLPAVEFHVVGVAPDQLAELRRTHGWPNLHLHARVPPAELRAQYARCAIALLPLQPARMTAGGGENLAKWDSPLKLFEYMAHGKAIVASDMAAFREVLADGETGILVAPDDLDGWTAAVARLVADPATAERLADAARQDFLARFTWDARAKRVLEAAPH